MRAVTFKKVVGMVLIIIYVLVVKDIPLTQIQSLPNRINITSEEVVQANEGKLFGRYVSVSTTGTTFVNSDGSAADTRLDFKLFGFIKFNSIKVNVLESDEVYVGGQPVGFSLNSEGVIVVGANSVITSEGRVDTLKTSEVKIGDIIKEIEGETVNSVRDIEKIINAEENRDKTLNLKAVRKSKEINIKLKPALDLQTKKYKMGLWVRDDAAGVGTLTYVRKDNRRFGALGHPICDVDTKVPFSVDKGQMYQSSIIGIKKGIKGRAGELKGLFLKGKGSQGVVEKNTQFGVFGVTEEDSSFIEEGNLVKIGGRLSARPGKAKIRVTLTSNKVEEYDIEIIKTNYQNMSKQKSMVIRVTDKELIKKTGGIVQGMSGSPIIQNNKIVGAVTHVFVNDPKKGFGVYIDWMINE